MAMERALDGESLKLLENLTEKQKDAALQMYVPRMKSTGTCYILWFFFNVYYFYLGKPMKNLFMWLLCLCFIGVIWWVIDLFRMGSIVRKRNLEILEECIESAKKLYPRETVFVKDIDA